MKARTVYSILFLAIMAAACDELNRESPGKEFTIFFFNDSHAQIDNFAKVQHIIEEERQHTDVVVLCAGDIFSGNPVVDIYEEKGYPFIDLMNKIGVDISVLGNHEFDYGQSVLAERMDQSSFDWVCANVDMGESGVPEPFEYRTLSVGDLELTFLGLLETNGKPDGTIPSTHPSKVQGISFERPENVVARFSDVKDLEESDLYIALTHLGHNAYNGVMGDFEMARSFPYFDLIIGGHSHSLVDTVVNNIPVFQAGSYLNYLGKLELLVKDKGIEELSCELIYLGFYEGIDTELMADIDAYNSSMAEVLDEVIGYANMYHSKYQLGCFYTDALRERLGVDVTFQNHGGIRSDLDEGDITIREIYEIDPFNNGTMIYDMTVSEIKTLFIGSGAGFYYSGIEIEQLGSAIEVRDIDGDIIPDNTSLTIGINDYIPAVNSTYFPSGGERKSYTTAEAIIYYLENINSEVEYGGCNHWFRYE